MLSNNSNIWNIFDNIKHSLESTDIDSQTDSKADYKTDYIASSIEDNIKLKEDFSLNISKPKIISNDIDEEINCYNCGNKNLICDDGIIVCEKCGINNGVIIDHGQEWRFYGNDENKSSIDPTRCGMPINPLLPESSLGTIILGKGYEKYKKLNNWNMMSYKERSLLKVFKYIQNKSDDKNISICVVDRAKIMYKTLNDNTLKRGKSKDGLIAACFYNSCKDKNDIRTPKEISKLFNIKIKKVTTGCKQFNEIMYYNDISYADKIKPITHEDCIDKFCNILHISQYKDKILYVANTAYELGLVSENMPSSIAVSCIYLISQHYKLNINKKKLSELCCISEVTITKTYKKMIKYESFILPKEDDEKVSNIDINNNVDEK